MSPFSAAVVGCGAIGTAHIRSLLTLPDVELAFVVDANAELADAKAAEFGVPPLHDIADIPEAVDFVTVATPPQAHYAVVRDLLGRGFHVFCEKPLTLRVAQGIQLKSAADAKGLHLGVGFKMRYEPWFAKARELVPQIGTLVGVTTTKQQGFNGKDWITRTGAMQELSSHDFDLVHWIAGTRPRRMLGARLSYRMGWQAEDGFSLLVEYANGMVGTLTGLYCEAMGWSGRDCTMRFHGEHGYVAIDRTERVVLHLDKPQEFTFDERPPTFALELADFAAAVAGGPARYPDAQAAIDSTWVVEHAYHTAGVEPP